MAIDFQFFPRSVNGLDSSFYMNELENTGQNIWNTSLKVLHIRQWGTVIPRNWEASSLSWLLIKWAGQRMIFLKSGMRFQRLEYRLGHALSTMMETLRQARLGRQIKGNAFFNLGLFCFGLFFTLPVSLRYLKSFFCCSSTSICLTSLSIDCLLPPLVGIPLGRKWRRIPIEGAKGSIFCRQKKWARASELRLM